METFSTSPALKLKLTIFNFFAFLLFNGLFAVFVYYKLFGGAGFTMASGYFEIMPGAIGLLFLCIAVALAYLNTSHKIAQTRALNISISILLFAFILSQLNIWYSKINDGLFFSGSILNTLSIDDKVYFTIYYFVSSFQILYALVIGLLYLLTGLKNTTNLTIHSQALFQVFKPLFFAACGVFVLFYLWN
jgi:hypothetical protein